MKLTKRQTDWLHNEDDFHPALRNQIVRFKLLDRKLYLANLENQLPFSYGKRHLKTLTREIELTKTEIMALTLICDR